MRRIVVSSAVVLAVVLAVSAGVPRQHLEAKPSAQGSAVPQVAIANFPLDEEGSILTAPVANRVFDFLDTGVVLVLNDPPWESEVFDTGSFTRVGLRMDGSEATRCEVLWRWTDDEPFVPSSLTLQITDTSPLVAFSQVDGLEAKVSCVTWTGMSDLFDVKILLRRE